MCTRVQAQATLTGTPNGNDKGYDMAPETTDAIVKSALSQLPDKIPSGLFEPTWASIQSHYHVPAWFNEARFGLFIHWGVYSVPAYHNEWYKQFMYGAGWQWQTDHFGSPDVFGYKDFIPKFTAAKFDADAWADLFKKSGARYVIPTAQHHDNFSLWDSQFNPYNAKQMGPHRDLTGELSAALRKAGLKVGISNHGIEAFQFIHLSPQHTTELKDKHADVYDPKWADFYLVADRSDHACEKFLVNWVQRNEELIDKYQPDLLWFDNGVDIRYLDPLKKWVAAYYYNRATQWGKEVTLSTKKAAYAPAGVNTQTIGSTMDFEKVGSRSPGEIRAGSWQVDDPIGSTWGYTDGMRLTSADAVIGKLADTASKNGNFLLNISPMGDGLIPEGQQTVLLAIGQWLNVNGEAIYGTHAWTTSQEGNEKGSVGPNVRFTVKGDDLFAILLGKWPGGSVTIKSLGGSNAGAPGKISAVSMLGVSTPLKFSQTAVGLAVVLPPTPPCKSAYTLRISGLTVNASSFDPSGNPSPLPPAPAD